MIVNVIRYPSTQLVEPEPDMEGLAMTGRKAMSQQSDSHQKKLKTERRKLVSCKRVRATRQPRSRKWLVSINEQISGVREFTYTPRATTPLHELAFIAAVRMNNIFRTSPFIPWAISGHSKALPSAVYCGANGVSPLSGLGQVAWQAKSFMRKEW